MKNVGFVGWRGMVGSVLMQRMVEERDFDGINPVFFIDQPDPGNVHCTILGNDFANLFEKLILRRTSGDCLIAITQNGV